MGRLDDKVALVTGAARGQGRAHATTLAREGADIVAVDIADQISTVRYPMSKPDDLAETVRQVEELDRRALPVQADVRSQTALDETVARGVAELGELDILVANAGIYSLAPFWKLTEEQWDDMIGVNLTGVWKSAKAVAPHMIERRSGAIVLTSSVNGLEPGPNYAHYVSAKHGVIGLMRNIALELAPYGVRCNAVCPGAIDTGMTNWQGAYNMFAGNDHGTRDDLIQGARHFHALAGSSVLPPEVIANAALWFASDEAAQVTGVAMPVDAGHMLLTGVNQSPVE
ncbi:MAG: mycofactocin-coupled SDR family oxidoreductase [Streptosporangiales bacterium]